MSVCPGYWLFLLAGAALLGCGDEADVANHHAAVGGTTSCWKIEPLPSSAANKPVQTVCPKTTASTTPADVVAKQQLYLSTWKSKLATEWKSLSAAEQETQRQQLKDAILAGKGVQP